jgi:thiol-disulfide isomerase/thioredoxin
MKRRFITRLIGIFLGLLFAHHGLYAQGLQKMNADELNNFIRQADKPVVISFWATWCGSCVEEIPYFMKTIKEKYAGKVDLILVSLDIKDYYPKKIETFAAKKNFNVPIIWLNEHNADIFCPRIDPSWTGAIPSTLMVNNKKQYRKFYEQGLTAAQFDKFVLYLVE